MSHIVYQLKISLGGSDPLIWRSLEVLGSTPLSDLHDMFQIAMGWQNEHFYQFVIDDRCYGDTELGFGDNRIDASMVSLGELIKRPKTLFLYEYDLNDGWEHEVIVEKIYPVKDLSDLHLPQCLAGENACPPEDSGGIFGYYELLALLKDPEHPAYDELKNQYGVLKPEYFDLKLANHRLQAVFHDEEPAHEVFS